MQLKISCNEEEGNSTYLDVYTENSTQGQRKLSWPFATKSIVEGVYLCRRRDDGALISNRSVIVDGNWFCLYVAIVSWFKAVLFCLRECSCD